MRGLGDPIEGEQLPVELTGVQGQPLRLSVIDLSGQVVGDRPAEPERTCRSGVELLLLQVSTSGQSQTVKVLKAQ